MAVGKQHNGALPPPTGKECGSGSLSYTYTLKHKTKQNKNDNNNYVNKYFF